MKKWLTVAIKCAVLMVFALAILVNNSLSVFAATKSGCI